MFSGLQSLCDNVCEAEFKKKLCENSFAEVAVLFERYMSFLCCKNGKLSEFWVSYLDLIDILLAMMRVSREGDWDLHLSSIRNLIQWCFAYNNLNYASNLPSYLLEMSHLEDEHPDILTYLKSSRFAVQLGEDNLFGKIPVNQACEESVNKDTQTPVGTKGFSLMPKAVNKYYLVAEYRSIFMRYLKDMLLLSKSSYRSIFMRNLKTRFTWANQAVITMAFKRVELQEMKLMYSPYWQHWRAGWTLFRVTCKTLSVCPQVRWLLRMCWWSLIS